LIEPGFQSIEPTPQYPIGVSAATLASYAWESRAAQVITFKDTLKIELRRIQLGRCCYCRRLLGDVRDTHLEHFLEKAAFPKFAFEICNLGLSCSTCNGHKNSKYLRISNFVGRKISKRTGVPTKVMRCAGLSGACGSSLPMTSGNYRWVHPHFDRFGNHIVIRKGWIYQACTPKGHRTIQSLRFNLLGEIERRNMIERLAATSGMTALLWGVVAEFDKFSAKDLVEELVAEIRARKQR